MPDALPLPEQPFTSLQGSCSLCLQEMVLTEEDCWHPHTVKKVCPPEVTTPDHPVVHPAFGDFGRPGREYFVFFPPRA